MSKKKKEITRKFRVYIAGPMRGKELYNFPAFNAAAKDLRGRGLEVFNPAEDDVKLDGFDPAKDEPKSMSFYMARDLPHICECDAVVVLDGWEHSKGASIEVGVARSLRKPIYNAMLLTVHPPLPSILQEADMLINGDRQASYGPPDQDFKRTADMWTGLLQYKMKDGEHIRTQDVASMMICLKLSRTQHSDKRDNWVDVAGYSGCAWKCIEAKQKRAEAK